MLLVSPTLSWILYSKGGDAEVRIRSAKSGLDVHADGLNDLGDSRAI